jgi:XTP/dITP diphosphohydrolase
MELVFASNNVNKREEIRKILPPGYNIISLHEAGIAAELPETGTTLRDNALEKARYVFDRTGRDCFADDTGLEVTALGGRPGVYSARYAGPACSAADNIARLLGELEGVADRRAAFRTVIALLIAGKPHFFEGRVAGVIARQPAGEAGFGYDPVFIPEGGTLTFAEMDPARKNRISHRAAAIRGLADFLARRDGYQDVDNPVD